MQLFFNRKTESLSSVIFTTETAAPENSES